MVTRLGPKGARGAVVPRPTLGNLSIAMVPHTTLAKNGILLTFLMQLRKRTELSM
jgi:hypothetical protein